MRAPKQNIIPPGGFFFEENGVRLESHSYQALAEVLLRYRIENKIPVGDPLKEIIDRLCDAHPHFCHETKAPIAGAGPSLNSAVSNWMARLYHMLRSLNVDFVFVTQAEADRRAAICASCPHNTEWKTGCGSCNSATQHVGFTFRAGRKAEKESELKACQITGQENPTAVWLKAPPPLTPEVKQALPSHCWRA